MLIFKIKKEAIPPFIRSTVTGLYCLELNGVIYYGAHSREQLEAALKKQPVRKISDKFIE